MRLTFSSFPALPRPNHAIDDLGQAVVPLEADGAAKSPASGDFSAQDVKCQHFSLPFHLYDTSFFDYVASLPQNLDEGYKSFMSQVTTLLYVCIHSSYFHCSSSL